MTDGVSSNYELHLTHEDGNDRMTVRFEPEKGIPKEKWNDIAETASKHIHKTLHVRLDFVPVEPESLPRYALKIENGLLFIEVPLEGLASLDDADELIGPNEVS